MLQAHPTVLCLSEFLTVVDPDKVFSARTIGGEDLWRLLAARRPDVLQLLAVGELSELLVRDNVGAIPALLLVPLQLPGCVPEDLFAELGAVVRGMPELEVGVALSAIFNWLTMRMCKTIWVERSGGSLQYLDCILHAWPNARIVHIWRDGADCARSMSRHPYFRVAVARAHTRNPLLDVGAALNIELPLARYGAYWSASIRRGVAALRSHAARGGSVTSVRYEDLLSGPGAVIEQLATAIDIPVAPGWATTCARMVRGMRQNVRTGESAEDSMFARYCQVGMDAIRGDG
jgi:hypothetical protein